MSNDNPGFEPDDQAENLEDQLEEGLEDSFPASDPPSVARRHRRPTSEPIKPDPATGQ
jgi:hypothetical protein